MIFYYSLNLKKKTAASSFGDSRILIEKYIRKPRHVEVQVFISLSSFSFSCFCVFFFGGEKKGNEKKREEERRRREERKKRKKRKKKEKNLTGKKGVFMM